MNNQSVEDAIFEWEFIAAFARAFKQHLRPLLMQVSFASHRSDDCLIEAITFLLKAVRLELWRDNLFFKKASKEVSKEIALDEDSNWKSRLLEILVKAA